MALKRTWIIKTTARIKVQNYNKTELSNLTTELLELNNHFKGVDADNRQKCKQHACKKYSEQ